MKMAFDYVKPTFLSILLIIVFITLTACKSNLISADDGVEKAVSSAILEYNSHSYPDGECQGEGHYTMACTKRGATLITYVLAEYGRYSFVDGNFVKVSGCGIIPTVITFSVNKDGTYTLKHYKEAEDGANYGKSIKRMFPIDLQNQCFKQSADIENKLKEQEQKYASLYLQSIGRSATIGEHGDFTHPLLTDLGISEDVVKVLDSFLKYHSNYPDSIGNVERVENGVRYIYQTVCEPEAHTITYSKLKCESKEVVEMFVFDSSNGKELSQP